MCVCVRARATHMYTRTVRNAFTLALYNQRCMSLQADTASCTHTHSYPHTYTQTHAYMHAYTHTFTHVYTRIHAHAYTRTYTHIYTHSYTRMHTRMHTHTCIHTHTRTYIHTHTHAYTHMHTHIRMHTHIHTYTHAGACCTWSLGGPEHAAAHRHLDLEGLPGLHACLGHTAVVLHPREHVQCTVCVRPGRTVRAARWHSPPGALRWKTGNTLELHTSTTFCRQINHIIRQINRKL